MSAPAARALATSSDHGGADAPTAGLHGLLDASAAAHPERTAVIDPASGEVTYAELAALSDRLRDRLAAMGVRPGDRVGIWLTKSIDAVAAIFGILKAGAAYVPVDPHAPATRNAYILDNCQVAAAVVEARFVDGWRAEAGGKALPPLIVVDAVGDGSGLGAALRREDMRSAAAPVESATVQPDDLAYVLYTSGSTGRPKGVMLSHRNALSYVAWCGDVFAPTPDDRFSSHAPFHFDLSILDIYVPIAHGAAIVLVGHEVGKDPERLAALIAEQRITVWYSAPSILAMLVQHGALEAHDHHALRLVLFAGEVFPVKHLRALTVAWPWPRYYNLYGPTETNVCTYYEVRLPVPEERTEPYPIGKTCEHLGSRVVDENGSDVSASEEGELVIAGPSVLRGYWGLAEQTARAFFLDRDGQPWYRTGDLVVLDAAGDFVFHGRRDRMIKKRGYRVELGEIEACLYQHPAVHEAAVVALADDEGVRVKAWVAPRAGEKLSIIALKRHCSERLPLYMVPDLFAFPASLPHTSTDKIDYQALKALG